MSLNQTVGDGGLLGGGLQINQANRGMDVVGLGLVTQSELDKILAPSINKTLKRTIDRKKMLNDHDTSLILMNKPQENDQL